MIHSKRKVACKRTIGEVDLSLIIHGTQLPDRCWTTYLSTRAGVSGRGEPSIIPPETMARKEEACEIMFNMFKGLTVQLREEAVANVVVFFFNTARDSLDVIGPRALVIL